MGSFFQGGGRLLTRAVLCSAGTLAQNRDCKEAVCDSREWVRLFSPGRRPGNGFTVEASSSRVNSGSNASSGRLQAGPEFQLIRISSYCCLTSATDSRQIQFGLKLVF
jgi:hypothetical protein